MARKKSTEKIEPKGTILEESLSKVIGTRFGRYSKYIIQDRALPDVRDGLKPVQRRILYAMFKEGNTSEKAFRKSAKTVGNVIGNYHPHGDTSVYDAMVRMSQDWKTVHPLIDIHGNNGSIDNDPAAAMRYTEARLSELSNEIIGDIGKNTVPFVPNFDDSDEEPTVLPSSVPYALIMGITGISAGYATDIPPHNLSEIIDATLALIDKGNLTTTQLLKYVKGPDFPLGGIVGGEKAIRQCLETGKGSLSIRSRVDIEEQRDGKSLIVVTEIPYDVVKQKLVATIDKIRINKQVDGILEVRDESNRNGLRIVIELKKDAPTDQILNYLYKKTDLATTYNYNMVFISERRPKTLGVVDVLKAFVDYRKEIVTKRTQHDLDKCTKRLHIVEGIIRALNMIDEIVPVIRESKDKKNAKENLVTRYDFTELQAEAIVSFQLYRLSNTDVVDLEKEFANLTADIAIFENILGDERELKNVIKKELRAIKKKYGKDRISEITSEAKEIVIDEKALIAEEDTFVSVSRDGYIKRSTPRSVNSSGGLDAAGLKEADELILVTEATTTDSVLTFFDNGTYAILPLHTLEDSKWKDVGNHINSIVTLSGGESVVNAFLISKFDIPSYITIVKDSGLVKRSPLVDHYKTRTNKAFPSIRMQDDEELVIAVALTKGDAKIALYSDAGLSLEFNEDEVAPKGVATAGMRGMNIKETETLTHAFISNDVKELKRIYGEYGYPSVGSRAQRGAKPTKTLKK